MNDTLKQNWAVCGGGILGMTVARRLRALGHRVTLIEAGPHLGGMADAWELGGVAWDRHYHVTLMSDLHTRAVLKELGLEDDMQWVETKTGFFTDGELYSMSNTLEFLKFPPLRMIDKFRLGSTIFYASKLKNWKKLEQIPVADWLRKYSGKRAFEKIWLPLLRSKLGENYKKTSAAFIWATIARMYAARRTGLKKEMFGYLPGGYARMLSHFESALRTDGVDVRTATPVQRVESQDVGVGITLADGEAEHFDAVAMTMPAPILSRVCPDLNADEHSKLNGLQYQGIVCASVLLKNSLSPYYVTNITDDWVPFTAVIEMSALVDKQEFDGNALVYLPKYVPPDDPVFERSDDDIKADFIAALAKMYPHFSPDDVLAFRLSRVRHVVALSTLNYSQNLPPMKTSVPGVYAVNSAHIVNGTLNVNETIRLADSAVEDVLSAHQSAKRTADMHPQLLKNLS